ncbi:unnamed protein product [Gongylonema pulchrum]|uniref:Alpha-carbonic anhydrase domain-containing protein n=1 Tax=Gongylonema pulchrum TaxID=637853 RepID=A0A183CXJ1_9BILA|nr:unnamed protein product [Gongylonema pulchrum]
MYPAVSARCPYYLYNNQAVRRAYRFASTVSGRSAPQTSGGAERLFLVMGLSQQTFCIVRHHEHLSTRYPDSEFHVKLGGVTWTSPNYGIGRTENNSSNVRLLNNFGCQAFVLPEQFRYSVFNVSINFEARCLRPPNSSGY